jgi:hypothetical protein
VVDQGRNRGIDFSETVAGGNAVGARRDDLFGIAGAGLRAALRAPGTNLVGQIEAFAFLGSRYRPIQARQDFFTDLSDKAVEFRGAHDLFR